MSDLTPNRQLAPDRTDEDEVHPVVLLVDDDRTVRTLLATSLSDLGCSILTAGNGEEALRVLHAKRSVDVLVTEVTMPVMGGLDLLRAARQSDRFKTLPIILCSSASDEATKEHAFEYGCDRYLTKPVHPELLFEQISNILQEEVFPKPKAEPSSTVFS